MARVVGEDEEVEGPPTHAVELADMERGLDLDLVERMVGNLWEDGRELLVCAWSKGVARARHEAVGNGVNTQEMDCLCMLLRDYGQVRPLVPWLPQIWAEWIEEKICQGLGRRRDGEARRDRVQEPGQGLEDAEEVEVVLQENNTAEGQGDLHAEEEVEEFAPNAKRGTTAGNGLLPAPSPNGSRDGDASRQKMAWSTTVDARTGVAETGRHSQRPLTICDTAGLHKGRPRVGG